MPFIKKIKLTEGIIGLWRKDDTLEDFKYLFPKLKSDQIYNRITSEYRKLEYLSVRALLFELTGKFSVINYENDGNPFLPGNDWQISISHSSELVAIILNKNKVGIDVEKQGRQMDRISSKFLSEKELTIVKQSGSKDLGLLLRWCAKEAIFKLVDQNGINFKTQIITESLKIEDKGSFFATFISENISLKIKLNYIFFENNAVVWCIR